MNLRPGSTNDASDRAGPARVGLGSRRVVWSAFAISAAVHLLAILLYPLVFEDLGPSVPTSLPTTTEPRQGIEVVELNEIDAAAEPVEPEDPTEIEDVDRPAADADAPVLEDVTGIEVVPLTGMVDRLRPALTDERLWRELPPSFYELTLEQREEVVVAARLAAWLDSVQSGLAAEAALTDWTFTDSKGGRWGVSPGKIHLGDVTLPLPLNFGIPVGKRDETNELVWQWEEIMRQAARADVEMTWKERAEAIRIRRDRERATTRPDTTGRR
jgi:hypothetical protein